jgi:hypothetical protein
MIKVDFSKVQLKDINGETVEIDFRKELGTQLYMRGQSMEESMLGQRIYAQKEDPTELTVDEASTVSKWVGSWPYVSRTAIRAALNKS